MTFFETSPETRRAQYFGKGAVQRGSAMGGCLLASDEQQIRRVIRHVITYARLGAEQCDVQYFFDLLPYLRDDAAAIIADEAARTLAEIVDGD